MFSGKKFSKCSSGHVEISFDNVVKQFLPKELEFFAHGTKNFEIFSTFWKFFLRMLLRSRQTLFWHPVEYPLLKIQLFLLIQKNWWTYKFSKKFSERLQWRRTIPFWQRFRYFSSKSSKTFWSKNKKVWIVYNFFSKRFSDCSSRPLPGRFDEK